TEDLLHQVQPAALEPLGAGHFMAVEHLAVGLRGSHFEVLPDRFPKGFQVVHGPPPEGVVIVEMFARALLQPALKMMQAAVADAFLAGLPQGHRIGCCHHSSPEHSLCIGRGRLLLFRHKPASEAYPTPEGGERYKYSRTARPR